MTKMNIKGQLSFDLAFAIILALIIFAALISYWQTSEASVQGGRVLMGLNMIADYTLGNLNAFHNSIGDSDNVTYTLDMLDDYLFGSPSNPDNLYDLGYDVSFDTTKITFRDASNPTTQVEREMGFDIDCTPSISLLNKGDVITFKTCRISGSHIKCASCIIT